MIPRTYRAHEGQVHSVLTATDPDNEVDEAQQQFRDEVDINIIVDRFGGMLPYVEGAVYGDFTGVVDYESALERIGRANADFMRLPAAVREKYGNDPAQFLSAADRAEFGEQGELFVKEIEDEILKELEPVPVEDSGDAGEAPVVDDSPSSPDEGV